MPTRAENPKAINKMSAEMMVGQPAMLEAAWAPATPSPTPIIPPMALRTTASTRNCRRMCRRLAPTAMRMPISRVRSVTETNKIFMIPIPPTSSEMDGTANNSSFMDSLVLVHDLSHLLRGFGREITGPDGPQELGAHDLPLGSGEGYEHHIILIVSPCVIPFGVERAYNLKRHVLDPNRGAHGIFSWLEQVLEDGIPQKRHFGGRVHLGLGKELSTQGSPSADDQVVWRYAVDRREPVFVLVNDLHCITPRPTGVGHTGDLLQLFHVRDGQRHRPAMSGPYPAESH